MMEFLYKQLQHGSSSELKMLDRRENNKVSYVGANLQTSRTPSAIDNHCRSSYQYAKRKLSSSRAKVRFYVAGENNHSAIYAVSPQRFSSFDSLLGSLTKTPLCSGDTDKERYIFSLNGSHKITDLDELQSGETYVCATYEVFEQLNEERERPPSTITRFKSLQNAALAAARPTHTSQSSRSRRSIVTDNENTRQDQSDETQFLSEIKPRLITVLRGGLKPRRSVRILLNRKNTRSFEQIIGGIADILCPGEQVKRLFGMSGRLVMCMADFYLEDSVFFAYSNDKMNHEDLILDKSEVKFVGAYRFRRASAYGRVTLTSHQKGVTNERPRSIPASALPDVYRLSSEPRAASRTASRARSYRPSIESSSPHHFDSEKEKQAYEPMEKESRHSSVKPSQPIKSDSRAASQASIQTLTPRNDQSKESIRLSPSRQQPTHDAIETTQQISDAGKPPPSPSKLHSARQSPSKESPRKASPSKESFSRQISSRQSLTKESPSRQSPTKDSSPRQSPSKESTSRHSPFKESTSRYSPSKDSPSRQSPSKESYARQPSSRQSLTKEPSPRQSLSRESPSRNSPSKLHHPSGASDDRKQSQASNHTKPPSPPQDLNPNEPRRGSISSKISKSDSGERHSEVDKNSIRTSPAPSTESVKSVAAGEESRENFSSNNNQSHSPTNQNSKPASPASEKRSKANSPTKSSRSPTTEPARSQSVLSQKDEPPPAQKDEEEKQSISSKEGCTTPTLVEKTESEEEVPPASASFTADPDDNDKDKKHLTTEEVPRGDSALSKSGVDEDEYSLDFENSRPAQDEDADKDSYELPDNEKTIISNDTVE